MASVDHIKISDVLKILSSWATESCAELCTTVFPNCRHNRARTSIVEINNAVAELETRSYPPIVDLRDALVNTELMSMEKEELVEFINDDYTDQDIVDWYKGMDSEQRAQVREYIEEKRRDELEIKNQHLEKGS